MAGIPMTAREQLAAARELGHELTVRKRGPWPEHGDPHPKFYVACSCGWESGRAWRSQRAASAAMAWHLGKVIADGVSA